MSWETTYGALLAPDDLDRLRIFVRTVDELLARRFFTKGTLGVLVEADAAKGVDFVSDHGDQEDFRSAMMTLRKLLMQKEPASMNRIVQILMQGEDEEARRALLRKSYAEIKAARKEPGDALLGEPRADTGLPVTVGRTREKLLDQLFNHQLFHNDPAPADLPAMTSSGFNDLDMNDMFLRHAVLEHAVSEAEFASWLAAFIRSKDAGQGADQPAPRPGRPGHEVHAERDDQGGEEVGDPSIGPRARMVRPTDAPGALEGGSPKPVSWAGAAVVLAISVGAIALAVWAARQLLL